MIQKKLAHDLANKKVLSESKFLALGTALLTLFFFLTLLFLGPPFFTFDSYDYLHLSLYPKAGSSHPLGFGFILYLLSRIADFVGPSYFTEIVLFWNAAAMALFFSLGLLPLRSFYNSSRSFKIKITFSILLLFLVWPILMGILFVSNAFWSEATNFLQIGLFALLAMYALKLKLWQSIPLSFILGAWTYHTRYSEIVLPMCFLGMAIVFIFRFFFYNFDVQLKKHSIRYFVLFLSAIAGVLTLTAQVNGTFPRDDGQKYVTSLVVSASIQCALRCDVELYQANCRNAEGREIIQNSKCSELIFGLKPFGASVVGPLAKPIDIFRYVGVKSTLKWFILAPFTYLTDTHALEMGLFQFGDDKLAATHYVPATNYYSRYLVLTEKKIPNPVFLSMVGKLDRYFLKYKIFHILTAISVFVTLFLIFSSQNPVVLFLSFYSFGTYLLFSYLNPHVPFRYLLLIILPCLLAGILSIRNRSKD